MKKTALSQFSRPRSRGLRAIALDEHDHLVSTAITDGQQDVMLFSTAGKATRFHEQDVRAMGRTSRGVRGIRLTGDNRLISMVIPAESGKVLTVSENGYGKRTSVDEFPTKGRGGQGVITMQASERNGRLVAGIQVFDDEEIMLISDQGTLVRTAVNEISISGRNTQGVRIIKLKPGEKLNNVDCIKDTE